MPDPICAHCGANVLTSNWPECCERFTEPESVSWRWTFIVVPQVAPCLVCQVGTRFVWPDFEGHCHPGACEKKLWADFCAAQ